MPPGRCGAADRQARERLIDCPAGVDPRPGTFPKEINVPISFPFHAAYGYCPSCGNLKHELPNQRTLSCYDCDTQFVARGVAWFWPDTTKLVGPFDTHQTALLDALGVTVRD